VDRFNPVSAHFKVQDFVRAQAALLDESVTADDDEELPFGVVPVLAFCDAWLADVDAHLTAVEGMDEFGEGASVVDVHLQWESDLFLWQVTQECAVELLGEGVLRNFRDHQGLWLVGKAVDQVNDFS